MTKSAASDAPTDDAWLALQLFISDPAAFGGIILRGDGPVRDAAVDWLSTKLGKLTKIPVNVDQERLLGGLDLAATLASGHNVQMAGLLECAHGGVIVVPMAERLAANVAAHIAQAMDSGTISTILLDDGCEPEEQSPAALIERMAFCCDLSALRNFEAGNWPDATAVRQVEPLSDAQLATLAATALALGVHSARALIFAGRAAHAHAALHGRKTVDDDDLLAAIRLVLSPRATQRPQMDQAEQSAEEQPHNQSAEDAEHRNLDDIDLEDIILEAAASAIPPHILDGIDAKARGSGKGQAGKAGQKQKSLQRGRPLGARPGVPGQGKRLALIDTLRAAAPWQRIRRQAATADDTRLVHIRKSDLRVRAFEQRSESLTIFAVDASGSSALSRLAEAKGAVEQMLAQAYVKRAQVALIAFRQTGAEILLPPTRSLTRARRALSALPGGGGTPLAAGLIAAQQLAEAGAKRGQTPTIAVLTDGKANVQLDGSAGREQATQQAQETAKRLAMAGLQSIVIDIAPRPSAEAAKLAEAMNGRYLPLPPAQSAAMVQAIESLIPQ